MRIHDLQSTGASAAETGRAQGSQPVERDGSNSSSPARSGSGQDQVSLSSTSRALHAGALHHDARVQRLAAEYKAGQYEVDPVRLSRAMVGEALQASAAQS